MGGWLDLDPDLYGRETDPDPGHINLQNNAMEKEFCVNKFDKCRLFSPSLKTLKKKFLCTFLLFQSIAQHKKYESILISLDYPGSGFGSEWRILVTWMISGSV